MRDHVAVIDIGMTNKKVAIYDRNLRLIDSISRTFDPLMVDGLETHDLEGIEEWFLDALAAFGARRSIGAIAVTTHGATMVAIGADGRPCAPCVLYTHEPGNEFQERFYHRAGDRLSLQTETGTPPLSAMINPAKGLLFLEERYPERFANARYFLNYPQYWGYRLSGELGAEGTYTGSHSYLWDWAGERYSSVAVRLGVAGRMPFPLRNSWDILGSLRPAIAARTGLSPEAIVTMGIHDSNASLLPHLAKRRGKDFILNSTGTWCVLMHPQESYGFEDDELGKVVFFNRSAYNKPVKTAIFLGGMEYEAWSKAIAASRAGAGDRPPEPSPRDYRDVIAAAVDFILPELVPGSGQFPGSRPRAVHAGLAYPFEDVASGRSVPAFLRDGPRAAAALNLSLAIQTIVSLERAGLDRDTEIYVEGGFRKNDGYNALLESALGDRVFLTDISEATAFGAAMTAVAAIEGIGPSDLEDRFEIDYRPVRPIDRVGDFAAYRAAWQRLVAGGGDTR